MCPDIFAIVPIIIIGQHLSPISLFSLDHLFSQFSRTMSLADQIAAVKADAENLLALQRSALDKATESKRQEVLDQIAALVATLSDNSDADTVHLRQKIDLLSQRGTLISVPDGAILWNSLAGQLDETLVQQIADLGARVYSPFFADDGSKTLNFYFALE